MPPRLLPESYGFVDTLREVPDVLVVQLRRRCSKISNQFAAMPSVHIAWATWCALALGPAPEASRAAKVLAVVLPGHHARS